MKIRVLLRVFMVRGRQEQWVRLDLLVVLR